MVWTWSTLGGNECQNKDWKIQHKFLCPQFKKVNRFDKEVVGDRALSLLEYSQVEVSNYISSSFCSHSLCLQEQRVRVLRQGASPPPNRLFIQ